MESFRGAKLHKMENNACCCLAKPQLGTTCYIPKNLAGWREQKSFHPAEIHQANTSGCRCGYIIFRKVTLPAYSTTDKQTVAQKSVLFNSFALAIQYHTSRIVEFAQISVVTNSFDAAIHWRSDYLALG